MKKKTKYLDLQSQILKEIKKKGGWVNAHAHIDRAFTITPERIKLMNQLREKKWALNKEIRQKSTVNQIYDRMAQATELMISQGVQAIGTFIDVDIDVKDKAIKAAQKIRERYKKDIIFKFLNQSSYGLFSKGARGWFDVAVDFVDIIGGLLKADTGRENEHLDILFQTAKAKNKMVHVHVDENNIPEEKETELLCKKTIEHGLQGKVVGIHGISINARPKKDREKIYELIKKSKVMFIACPMSWINSRRCEKLSPIHNPITPFDEMYEYKIPVAIGTDNLADIFMAFNDGNMWNDLRLLMECNRFYNIDEIVKVATTNGLKALGLE